MIKEYLKSFHLLTDDDIDLLIQKGKLKKLEKGEFLIKEGTICSEIAFVLTGFFRSFCTNDSGEEITYCFTFSNSFATAYSSFISQTPSFENIQALSEVTLLMVPREVIIELEKTNTNWLNFSKVIAEQEFIKLEQRVLTLLKENAEKRYKDLLETYPEYLQLIPLNYLASYLGITQRHLSRIRKNVFF